MLLLTALSIDLQNTNQQVLEHSILHTFLQSLSNYPLIKNISLLLFLKVKKKKIPLLRTAELCLEILIIQQFNKVYREHVVEHFYSQEALSSEDSKRMTFTFTFKKSAS